MSSLLCVCARDRELFRAWTKKMVLFSDACESLIRLVASRNDVKELNQVLTYMTEHDIKVCVALAVASRSGERGCTVDLTFLSALIFYLLFDSSRA